MPLARLHSRVWGSYKLQRWNIWNCAQMVCQALDWLPTSRERKKHDVFDAAEQHIFESRGLKSAEQSKEDHTRKENVWSGFWSGRWKLSQVIFTWRERLGACWNVCAIQWWNQRWGCRGSRLGAVLVTVRKCRCVETSSVLSRHTQAWCLQNGPGSTVDLDLDSQSDLGIELYPMQCDFSDVDRFYSCPYMRTV